MTNRKKSLLSERKMTAWQVLNANSTLNRKYNINGDLRDCVLIMKTKDGFEIIKNLDDKNEDFVKIIEQSEAKFSKFINLLNKYGPEYKKIAEQLGDYVSCDADIMASKHSIVVYDSGETGIFSPDGEMIWSSDLNYQGCEINGVAVDGAQFWSVVPDKNCIVCYSVAHKKFSMRIGSAESTSFQHPVSISKYDDELFICNTDSRKVRTINLKDFSVNDYRIFDEPVYKYLRSCGKEIVVLESGVYVL